MRKLYDGINTDASAIKWIYKTGDLVAGYDAGTFIWSQAEWNLFPPSARVTITPTASHTADVLDVETGDATPEETEGWIKKMKLTGYMRPTIYCSLSVVPDVRKGTGPYIFGKDYDLWIADWDGTTVLPYPAAAAKQFRNTSNYDVSVVFDDHWPHRDELVSPTRTVTSPSQQIVIPGVADHVVIEAYAIVHGKPQLAATWRVS